MTRHSPTQAAMQTDHSQQNRLRVYFVLVFVLSIPLWLLGRRRLALPINLPISALTALVPFIAAAILVYRQSGFLGVRELLKRAWDYKRSKNAIWYVPALLLAPLIYVLSYALMRLSGRPLPDPVTLPLGAVPIFLAMFLISDAGEELGWSGYALDPLQNRWGATRASIFLGVVWALWHSTAFVQTGYPATWVIWQCIKTVGMRIVIVWTYNNAGKSVFAANLYHTTDNLSWSLFPNFASHYDPSVTGTLTWLVAAAVLIGRGVQASGRRHAGASGA